MIDFQEQLGDQDWLVQQPWAGVWDWKTAAHFIFQKTIAEVPTDVSGTEISEYIFVEQAKLRISKSEGKQ